MGLSHQKIHEDTIGVVDKVTAQRYSFTSSHLLKCIHVVAERCLGDAVSCFPVEGNSLHVQAVHRSEIESSALFYEQMLMFSHTQAHWKTYSFYTVFFFYI